MESPGPVRLSVRLRHAVLVAAGLMLGGFAAVRLVHTITWGAPPTDGRHLLVLGVLVGCAAHELLHALAFLVAGARWSDLRFGASLRHGLLYVGCRADVPASAYRLVLLAPGALLGLAPLVVGLAAGSYRGAQLGAALLGAAGGDLCTAWAMRGVPADARVVEDPSDVRAVIVRSAHTTSAG